MTITDESVSVLKGKSEKGLKVAQAYQDILEKNLSRYVNVNLIISDSTTLSASKIADQMNRDLVIGSG